MMITVALGVGHHCDVHFLQDVGKAPPFPEASPAGDCGESAFVCGGEVIWKAGRANFLGEGDRLCQKEDGVVVIDIIGVLLVVRVVDNLSNIDSVELSVGNVVLSKQHPNVGCRQLSGCTSIYSAMGSSEDVG